MDLNYVFLQCGLSTEIIDLTPPCDFSIIFNVTFEELSRAQHAAFPSFSGDVRWVEANKSLSLIPGLGLHIEESKT